MRQAIIELTRASQKRNETASNPTTLIMLNDDVDWPALWAQYNGNDDDLDDHGVAGTSDKSEQQERALSDEAFGRLVCDLLNARDKTHSHRLDSSAALIAATRAQLPERITVHHLQAALEALRVPVATLNRLRLGLGIPKRTCSRKQCVLVIRHADRHDYAVPSWATVVSRLSGGLPRDPPLSALGHHQALEVSRVVSRLVQTRQGQVTLLCSPYLRCIQTAVPTARRLSVALQIEPLLAEVRHCTTNVPHLAERFLYFPEIDLDASLNRPQPHDHEEGWPVDYLHRIRTCAADIEKRLGDHAATLLCFSHEAAVSLVACLCRSELSTDDTFSPAGVYVLARDNPKDAFELVRSGASNSPYVSVNSHTTRSWGFSKMRLAEWANTNDGARFPDELPPSANI